MGRDRKTAFLVPTPETARMAASGGQLLSGVNLSQLLNFATALESSSWKLPLAESITIAVSKGRIYDESVPLLAKVGVRPLDDPRAQPTSVAGDAAQRGEAAGHSGPGCAHFCRLRCRRPRIAGKDVLLEYPGEAVYEPLDLGIARCRMVVACRDGMQGELPRPRVATKYVNTTRRHFARQGVQARSSGFMVLWSLPPSPGLPTELWTWSIPAGPCLPTGWWSWRRLPTSAHVLSSTKHR